MPNLKQLAKTFTSPSVVGMFFISTISFIFMCCTPVFSQLYSGIAHILPKNCPEIIICLSSALLLLAMTLSIGLFIGVCLNKHFENQKTISRKLDNIKIQTEVNQI